MSAGAPEAGDGVTWHEITAHEPERTLEYWVDNAPQLAHCPGERFLPRRVVIVCRWRGTEWGLSDVVVHGRTLEDDPVWYRYPTVTGRPEWLHRLIDEALAEARTTRVVPV